LAQQQRAASTFLFHAVPRFYRGGQFTPGGGRAPAGGVWM
jgi:hypothetical protein